MATIDVTHSGPVEVATIQHGAIAAYKIPTDAPESDGTLKWDSTTLVTVHISAGGEEGFGYTYAPAAAGKLIDELLLDVVADRDVFNIEGCWQAMVHAVRNAGQPGIASCAISAVDTALWDLKAKLLGLPLYKLWGAVRDQVPLYGSGGFTSYDDRRLQDQLGGWASDGFTRVKMKVGRRTGRRCSAGRAARRRDRRRRGVIRRCQWGVRAKAGTGFSRTIRRAVECLLV